MPTGTPALDLKHERVILSPKHPRKPLRASVSDERQARGLTVQVYGVYYSLFRYIIVYFIV